MTDKPENSTQGSSKERPGPNEVGDELYDDPLLADSLASLSRVEVPTGFLPNVMYRVYETHLRERISLRQIGIISMVLILMCFGFFAWDVQDYTRNHALAGFGEGLDRKTDEMVAEFDSLVEATDGALSATWQMVTALSELLFSGNRAFPIAILIGVVVALIVFFNKWKSKNSFKGDAT